MNGHLLTFKEKKHVCTICNNNFVSISHLKVHLLTHTGEKPHECGECTKSFSKLSSLKTHLLSHSGEKPYKCPLCINSFSRHSTLKLHLQTHTGVKPHKCKICNTSFSQRSNLRSHLLTHTGDKPHKCHICNNTYTRLGSLQRHLPTHSQQKLEICNIDFSVHNKSLLTNDQEKLHAVYPLKCKICNNIILQDISMKRDIGQKSGICNVCSKSALQSLKGQYENSEGIETGIDQIIEEVNLEENRCSSLDRENKKLDEKQDVLLDFMCKNEQAILKEEI